MSAGERRETSCDTQWGGQLRDRMSIYSRRRRFKNACDSKHLKMNEKHKGAISKGLLIGSTNKYASEYDFQTLNSSCILRSPYAI